MYCLTVLKFRSLKSRHLQSCFLQRAIRKGSASVLLSWLVCVHLFPYLFTLLSLYACLLLCQIFCFYKEPVIWIRAILVTWFYLCKNRSPSKVKSQGTVDEEFNISFLEGHNSTHNSLTYTQSCCHYIELCNETHSYKQNYSRFSDCWDKSDSF